MPIAVMWAILTAQGLLETDVGRRGGAVWPIAALT